ncbi:nicotinamidase-related amidase [Luteibacter rhizovicinus]|uniref:Nicotinamidase-related amidase n=1 Tax=Luteibacter rhizovicinus TaxID=242606 RepID=A0A4R3YNY8_9GAMM|nr:hydrolase [Luteibacter rhizovicinus]TCV93258.1 nicotinamidase-related amidase [Luteibacter rhizovicinus]
MTADTLDSRTTALVLIDLQQGILPYAQGPYTGDQVVARAVRLADRFRELGAPIVRVRVGFSPDFADALKLPVDQPNPAASLPANWWDDIDALKPSASDIDIVKRQWGAFYGTELDLQLRRRGIANFVLAGISTNIGVESTARSGWEHGYGIVFAEDAMSSGNGEHHQFAVANIFTRIGRVRSTDAVLDMLR